MKRARSVIFPIAAVACMVSLPAPGWAEGPVLGGQRFLPLKAQLGQKLFFDSDLSTPPGQSCSSCHDPNAGFSDPDLRTPTSKGVIPGRFGSRNAPTAAYSAFAPAFHFDPAEGLFVGGQFLDGRAATLEDQAGMPFLNPLEMANPDKATVVSKVRQAHYADLFRAVYGPKSLAEVDRAYDRIADAIAAFENTRLMNRFSSKYDAYLAGKAELTPAEASGLRLFEDPAKGNCAACHPSAPGPGRTPPLFTDYTYDNLGVPRNPANPFYGLPAEFNPEQREFVDRGLGAVLARSSEDGKFKVPTLRNVAVSGPYMHNGYFASLRAVVAFYNDRDVRPACKSRFVGEAEALRRGCWPRPEVTHNVNRDELGRLGLTDQEVDDIVVFLQTLTDGYRLPTVTE